MDSPFFIVLIILYLLIYFSARKKAKKKEEEQKAANDRRYATSNRPQPNTAARSSSPSGYSYGTARPQASSCVQSQSYNIDSTHYHKEGYDFATCFSFKDVPKGADELTALIAANSRHERELQKLLHTRD